MNKEEAYDAGYETGYDAGREESTTEYYDTGYSDGHEEGYSEGYEEGYSEGLDEGKEYVDETAFEEFQSDIIALETESFEQQLMETQQVLQKCLRDLKIFV
jgi:flagellar biosynthesis/type III secretory pathway protein FliH